MSKMTTSYVRGVGACSIGILLIVGCNLLAAAKTVDERVVKLFGGETNLAPILKPARVEAFRVASAGAQAAGDAAGKTIADWPITAGPLAVDAQTAAELTAILTDQGTYLWDSAKGCEFDPGVAIRFTDDAGATDILFCFSCDEMAVVRGGRRIGGEDTDNARKKLVAIAKRLFADDATIQALDKS